MTVGLVVSEPRRDPAGGPLVSTVYADPFFGRIVSGILGELGPRRVHPLLIHVDSVAARDELLARLRQGDVDGVALVSVWPDDPLPELLARSGAPAVLFTRPARPAPVSYVDVGHRQGARLAAGHLRARGCRRVVTIAGPVHLPASQDRLDGFRDALAEHGRPGVPSVAGNFTVTGGRDAMARLLAEVPDLDGVFAANDLMAQGALLALADHGREVPAGRRGHRLRRQPGRAGLPPPADHGPPAGRGHGGRGGPDAAGPGGRPEPATEFGHLRAGSCRPGVGLTLCPQLSAWLAARITGGGWGHA